MRCGSAQKLIVAAVDGEITPERRRDLDEHVAACIDCLAELRATESLLGALESLPQEAEVPSLVEAATISFCADPHRIVRNLLIGTPGAAS